MTALHLRDARLIDPEAGTETEGDLLIDNGAIAAVGDVSPPPGARTLDCAG
ncbi:MAG: dihydroorotase, partial [Pseudomonadota bacterium]